jgi:polyene glycosyltransferase
VSKRPVLFVSSAEAGLLNPLLVLAGELGRRGVPDLWFATDEQRRADVTRLDGDVGFVSLGERVPELCVDTWDDEVYRAATQPAIWPALRSVALHMADPSLSLGKYRALDAAIDRIRPALVVIDNDLSDYAVRLALARKIPFVLSVPYMPSSVVPVPPGFPAPFSGMRPASTFREHLAVLGFKLRLAGLKVRPAMLARAVRFANAAKRTGIPASALRMWSVPHADLILCYTVAGLEYPFTPPDNVHLVGAMVPPVPQTPGDTELLPWLDSRRSIVYIGLGTLTRLTAGQVRAFVAVARALSGEHDVLWKLPADQQRLLPRELPPNLRVMSWVPSQLDVLAHPNVRAFVSHGGSNGFHEGLFFGKPQLIRPLWADCHDHAVRGEDAGVSLSMTPDVDVATTARDLRRLLTEESFTVQARRIGELQRQAGGRQAAADKLLALPAMN